MRFRAHHLLALLTGLVPVYLAGLLIPELATPQHYFLAGLLIGGTMVGWAAYFTFK